MLSRRLAFASSILLLACGDTRSRPTVDGPTGTATLTDVAATTTATEAPVTSAAPVASETPTGAPSATSNVAPWRHPTDAEGHLIMQKAKGSCYVQVPKKTPPPKDLMSGERWVDDKKVECPPEFADPAFAAIGAGMYWVKKNTGECAQARTFGDPPPPSTVVPCPAVIPH